MNDTDDKLPHRLQWRAWALQFHCLDCGLNIKKSLWHSMRSSTVPGCPNERTDWTDWYNSLGEKDESAI